jgi:hypothetical protein
VRTQAESFVKTMHSISALSITAICIVFLCYKPTRLSLSLARENLAFKTVREGQGALVDTPRERWTPELKKGPGSTACLHLPAPDPMFANLVHRGVRPS